MISSFFPSTKERPHIIFVLGKGGVGKTTVSLLTGISLTNRGKVLLVSLDPAKHLASYVGFKVLEGEVRVDEGLEVKQLDLELEIRKYTERHAQWVNDLMPSLKVLNIENAVDVVRYFPGVEEECSSTS